MVLSTDLRPDDGVRNWVKLEALCLRGAADLKQPDGTSIKTKASIVYLGSLLSADGRAGPELSRRLGLAHAEFGALQAIWGHSTMSRHGKVRVFSACVVPRLLYSILTMPLNAGELWRLDAFQARCLRRIARIPPSFFSRVASKTVLEICGQRMLSEQVVQQQVIYMGRLARRDSTDPGRAMIFQGDSLNLRRPEGKLRRGRPRNRWRPIVLQNRLKVAGSPSQLAMHFRPEGGAAAGWKSAVRSWHLA